MEAAGREVPPPKAEPDDVPNAEPNSVVSNEELNMDGAGIDPAAILIDPSTDPIDVGLEVDPKPDPVDALDGEVSPIIIPEVGFCGDGITGILVTEVTAFPPAETAGTGFLGSKAVSTTLFGDTTVDAVDEANADLTDAADDTSHKPVLHPVPMIVALEPTAPRLELPTAVLSLSVQEGTVEIGEEDDPKGESAPTLEIVSELALGSKQTEMEQDLPSALPDENPFVSELGRLLVVGFPSKPRVLSKLLVAEVTEFLSTDTCVT